MKYTFLFLLPIVCNNVFSSCNQAPRWGMESTETPDVFDSDEEAIAHVNTLKNRIKTDQQRVQTTREDICCLNDNLSSTRKTLDHHRNNLRNLDNAWNEYHRLNRQPTTQYPTHCKHCNATYAMNRGAYQEMINRADTRGTTYKETHTSYKWFLWAKWDHRFYTYITHMDLENCLKCTQEWSRNYHTRKRRDTNNKFDLLLIQLNGARGSLNSLFAKIDDNHKGVDFLSKQSARKLHHKRQKKIEEQRLKETEQKIQDVEEEKASLAKKTQEIATQLQHQRECVALRLLDLGNSVQVIAQATGLEEAYISALHAKQER
mmetsp:Transcript_3054/g.6785  ORF Transcript_3054/g.6785 Transcript_3054/m.6785 type:complete len:318 (+) Transcript_3054:82-1035(+)